MMTDVVSIYYEPVKWHGKQDHTIAFCADSWRKLGWQVKILGREHAMRHPLYQKYLMKMSVVPSLSPAGYDLACWLRWLAFSVDGGGLAIDFDVINRDFRPGYVVNSDVLIGDLTRTPCMVFATSDGAEDIVQRIYKKQMPATHYSDMFWFQESPYPHVPICYEIGLAGWKEAQVRHFSVKGCRNYNLVSPNKLSVMQDVLSKE